MLVFMKDLLDTYTNRSYITHTHLEHIGTLRHFLVKFSTWKLYRYLSNEETGSRDKNGHDVMFAILAAMVVDTCIFYARNR